MLVQVFNMKNILIVVGSRATCWCWLYIWMPHLYSTVI